MVKTARGRVGAATGRSLSSKAEGIITTTAPGATPASPHPPGTAAAVASAKPRC